MESACSLGQVFSLQIVAGLIWIGETTRRWFTSSLTSAANILTFPEDNPIAGQRVQTRHGPSARLRSE